HVDLSSAILRSANLSYADLSHVDLSSANLSAADLSYADLSGAILLSTDLRHCKGFTSEQLTGNDGPLLCNIALPFRITDIDPNRDCDRLPQALSDRYGIPLEEAQKIVDEARQKQ
ncbi:MAG: pentapeptide repeat-containing protein, partial [Elainellaceae cyanobacterium]